MTPLVAKEPPVVAEAGSKADDRPWSDPHVAAVLRISAQVLRRRRASREGE